MKSNSNDINLITTRADRSKALRKEAIKATERSLVLFKLIKGTKWNEVLRQLEYHETDAEQWIEEVNDDGSKRWRSLPIHLVCERNPPLEVVKQLIRCHPESLATKNYGEDLPIHIACREGASKEVIELMLQKNYNTVSKADCEGRLPLHIAAGSTGIHIKTIQDLILFYEKGARTPDDFGLLPLHWACSRKAKAIVVETIIKANPYAIEHRDSYGRLPIDLAKKANHGGKASIIDLLSRDPSSWTNAMMSTIVSLNNKVHAAEAMEHEFERQMSQIKELVDQNARSDHAIQSLNKELENLEDNFGDQIREIKKAHGEQVAALSLEKKTSEKKANDLKVLVDELVEQLKSQKTFVNEKEASRRELKEKAVSLVRHLEVEKKSVLVKEEENEHLRQEKQRLSYELEKKEQEIKDMQRREEELQNLIKREQELQQILRKEKSLYVARQRLDRMDNRVDPSRNRFDVDRDHRYGHGSRPVRHHYQQASADMSVLDGDSMCRPPPRTSECVRIGENESHY